MCKLDSIESQNLDPVIRSRLRIFEFCFTTGLCLPPGATLTIFVPDITHMVKGFSQAANTIILNFYNIKNSDPPSPKDSL